MYSDIDDCFYVESCKLISSEFGGLNTHPTIQGGSFGTPNYTIQGPAQPQYTSPDTIEIIINEKDMLKLSKRHIQQYDQNTGQIVSKKDLVKNYLIYDKSKKSFIQIIGTRISSVANIEGVYSCDMMFEHYIVYEKDFHLYKILHPYLRKEKIKNLLKKLNINKKK